MFDGEAFGAEVVAAVKAYMAREVEPLRERIATLERSLEEALAKAPVEVEVGPDEAAIRAMIEGAVAKAMPELPALPELPAMPELPDIGAMVDEAVKAAVEALPTPKDGKDVEPEAIKAMIDEAVASIPAPKDGADADMEAVRAMVDEAVAKGIEALPKAEDGKDGIGLAGGVIDQDGALVLTLTNGETRTVGRVVGRDGADADMEVLKAFAKDMVDAIPRPKDGKDGFDLKDFDATLMEDGRTVLLKFEQGDLTHSIELCFPVTIHRGVYRPETEYERGDGVTFGGSTWIANRKTSEKPGEGSGDWTLSVKRGRDGKDGVAKNPPPEGPVKL